MTIRNRTTNTSTTSADLQAQLRDAQNKRQQAAQAEADRLAAERKHAEEIAAEDARIAALQGQLAESRLNEAAQRDQEHSAANMMVYNDIMDALNALSPDILQGVQAAWDAMSTQLEAQRDNAMRGMQQYQGQLIRESQGIAHENHKYMHQQNALIQAQRKFTTPLPIYAAFVMWVARASTPEEKRFRQAIGFMFYGTVFEPSEGVTEDQLRGNHAREYWPR